jgi:hypothetical protein
MVVSIVAIWLIVLPLEVCKAESLELIVKDFTRSDHGYVVRFSVKNNYTYDRNPIVAFKILDDGIPMACRRVNLTVTKGANGSQVEEIRIDAPHREGLILESKIFERVRRNRVGGWLADCP